MLRRLKHCRHPDRMVVCVSTVVHLLYGMSIVAVLLQECRSVEQQSAVTKVVSYSYHTHVTFPMFSMASSWHPILASLSLPSSPKYIPQRKYNTHGNDSTPVTIGKSCDRPVRMASTDAGNHTRHDTPRILPQSCQSPCARVVLLGATTRTVHAGIVHCSRS